MFLGLSISFSCFVCGFFFGLLCLPFFSGLKIRSLSIYFLSVVTIVVFIIVVIFIVIIFALLVLLIVVRFVVTCCVVVKHIKSIHHPELGASSKAGLAGCMELHRRRCCCLRRCYHGVAVRTASCFVVVVVVFVVFVHFARSVRWEPSFGVTPIFVFAVNVLMVFLEYFTVLLVYFIHCLFVLLCCFCR